MEDVIIIGAGAAGISAALWCDDLGLSATLIENACEIGGQLLWTHNPIKNYLGVETKNGRELKEIFESQIANRRVEVRLNTDIKAVNLQSKQIILTNGEILTARNLILATGVNRRKLNIGEDDFKNKGLLESGKRDAKQTQNKRVCIVGGGDAAAENAVILSEYAEKVYLVHRKKDFRARAEFLDKIETNPKVEVLTETEITKIAGENKIETVDLQHVPSKKSSQINVDFVLLRLGVEPKTELFRGQIETDESGYIKINENCETNLQDVYAIGDVANPLSPTISGASGDGAKVIKIILARDSANAKRR